MARNTTCADLFTNIDLQCCCSKCYNNLGLFTASEPRRQLKNKDIKSSRNKCEKQWDSAHVTSTSKALRHKEVCETLGLSTDFSLDD